MTRVAKIASAVVISVAVALLITLVLAVTISTRATTRVADAASDAADIGFIESRFRNQERIGALYRLSDNPAYAAQRRDEIASLRLALRTERLETEDAYERRLLVEAETALSRHLAEQARLDQAGAAAEDVVQLTQPSFTSVLRNMQGLRAIHRERIAGARRTAALLRTVAIGAGLVAFVLITATMIGFMAGLRRWVFRPLNEVARALDRIGTGDRKTTISQPLPSEIGELAGSVNQLAGALEGQRENQVRYLGMLAHDLRNPLAGIRLALDTIRKRGTPDSQREHACDLVHRQLDRFERMVNELLDASRVEAGRLDLKTEPCDLRTIATEVVELHRGTTATHELLLHSPPNPVVAPVDPMRIEQVLENVLVNAIRHSPQRGRIDVFVEQGETEACLRVVDQGAGIPREFVEKIFIPFFQRARKNDDPGSGLGLAIARQIVEAHHGRIEVESAVGQGSTFRIHLPREDPDSSVHLM